MFFLKDSEDDNFDVYYVLRGLAGSRCGRQTWTFEASYRYEMVVCCTGLDEALL